VLGLADDVDMGDPVAGEDEVEDHERLSAAQYGHAGGPADECGQGGLRPAGEPPGHGGGAVQLGRCPGLGGGVVGDQVDIGIQEAEQRLEVSVAGGGEEGAYQGGAPGRIGVGGRVGRADAAAGPAGEHLGRGRAAPEDRRDLGEGHGEQVVQDEREPFGRGQRVEHHDERGAHRVGQERFLLGIDGVLGGFDRLVERMLAPRGARAQHVQADAPDDGGQPAAEVVHGHVRAVQPQPGLLDGVIGFGGRSEHPVRDRPQAVAVRLECLREPVPSGAGRVRRHDLVRPCAAGGRPRGARTGPRSRRTRSGTGPPSTSSCARGPPAPDLPGPATAPRCT
jgi:hypothetical protein